MQTESICLVAVHHACGGCSSLPLCYAPMLSLSLSFTLFPSLSLSLSLALASLSFLPCHAAKQGQQPTTSKQATKIKNKKKQVDNLATWPWLPHFFAYPIRLSVSTPFFCMPTK
ncbi:MAG: hypothetical protein JOS17DRAFT_249704 [Linnemannia elongata]|nr:MAG: hypothetical protein JOS17DRAFT_249704 [Linnemannia elongata]